MKFEVITESKTVRTYLVEADDIGLAKEKVRESEEPSNEFELLDVDEPYEEEVRSAREVARKTR